MKVLVCDSISPRAVERMRKAGLEVDVDDKITPGGAAREVIGGYDAMVVRSRTKVRKQVIDCGDQPEGRRARRRGRRQHRRRLRPGQGHQDPEHPRRQHALGRRADDRLHVRPGPADRPGHRRRCVTGKWEKSKFDGIELQGKMLGIIGMGRIGLAVAPRAARWACSCSATTAAPSAPAPFMQMVELDELLAKADFISLHIPLTESSKHMINAEMIAKMKDRRPHRRLRPRRRDRRGRAVRRHRARARWPARRSTSSRTSR